MNKRNLLRLVVVYLILLARFVAADSLDFTADSLPAESLDSYNVDISQSSVSGLSAGAFMADQFFVAFSGEMLGLGIFAGGPYGCSSGNLNTALGRCMSPSVLNRIDAAVLRQLHAKAAGYAGRGNIDALENLPAKRIYIFTGTLDTVVLPEVTAWVDDWYALAGVPAANIIFEDGVRIPHAMPTMDYGNSCTMPGNPWINDCDVDGAEKVLRHILGNLNPKRPRAELSGRFIKFYQNEFFDPPHQSAEALKNNYSMNEFGFAYIPKTCSDGEACRIHVVFHGCKQVYNRNPDASDFNPDDASHPFDLQYVKYAGYNEWADTNHLIILYPQAQKVAAMNPRGCFDWWGYLPGTGDTYATKLGPQMSAVHAMMERIAEGTESCEGTNQPPTITLAGALRIDLERGDPLILPDPEATAVDPEDGDITTAIVRTPSGSLDTSRPGTYELIYSVQDSAGCPARKVVRTVVVSGRCEQWAAANRIHAQENRAIEKWCFWFYFFPYRCYVAVGSQDHLGTGSSVTTLRRESSESEFYQLGACP